MFGTLELLKRLHTHAEHSTGSEEHSKEACGALDMFETLKILQASVDIQGLPRGTRRAFGMLRTLDTLRDARGRLVHPLKGSGTIETRVRHWRDTQGTFESLRDAQGRSRHSQGI